MMTWGWVRKAGVQSLGAVVVVAVCAPVAACGASVVGTAQTSDGGRPPPSSAPPVPTRAPGWTAEVELRGRPGEIPSPTGDLVAVIDGGSVCLRAGTDPTPRCVLRLAAGVTPRFMVFSPTGAHLLVVAGVASRAEVYLVDAGSGAVRVIGRQGFEPGASRWDLSSAVWDVEGTAVLLVPRTTAASGPVIAVPVAGGTASELLRLPAELANSSPSLWTTATGLAVVPNSGESRNILWWADFHTKQVEQIGRYGDPGGSLLLGSADPLGRSVVVCPRRADGRLGAAVGISVLYRESARLLPDARTCAASVFSADGRYLAVAAQLSRGYTLAVVEPSTGVTLLTVPLPVTMPSVPPYLTWAGDVIIASAVTGGWPVGSVVVRIRR